MKQTKTILLAEDNEGEFVLMHLALRKVDSDSMCRRVRDGEEAIRYLQGEGPYRDRQLYPFPNLLLLDLNMPLMNGFEVLRWIRRQPFLKHLVVTILSSSSAEDDIARACDSLVNSYLVKPMSPKRSWKWLEEVRVTGWNLIRRHTPPARETGLRAGATEARTATL